MLKIQRSCALLTQRHTVQHPTYKAPLSGSSLTACSYANANVQLHPEYSILSSCSKRAVDFISESNKSPCSSSSCGSALFLHVCFYAFVPFLIFNFTGSPPQHERPKRAKGHIDGPSRPISRRLRPSPEPGPTRTASFGFDPDRSFDRLTA